MDKEIIELLKSVAGSAETLVIWYMALDFIKHIITWVGTVACFYWIGKGVAHAAIKLKDSV